ncbi:hypothetical protein BH11MYX3_BH11MYX3_25300 [soil metagenome]
MTPRWSLIAMLCGIGACVDSADPLISVTGADDPAQERWNAQLLVDGDDAADDGTDICELLPASGPCSLACDPHALGDEYLPVNSCGAFACELTDGRQVIVHACHVAS